MKRELLNDDQLAQVNGGNKNSFSEMFRCGGCGKYFEKKDLINGLCKNCSEKNDPASGTFGAR